MTTQQQVTKDKWNKAYDAMQTKVAESCRGAVQVRYSPLRSYHDGTPMDDLDSVIAKGAVAVLDDKHHYEAGDQMLFISPIIYSPTWLDLAVIANDMLNRTMDNHTFLENYQVIGKHGNVTIIALTMGS